jgi:uncharacterized iron-regulated membrane protein
MRMFLATVTPEITNTTLDPALSGAAGGILAGTILVIFCIELICIILMAVGLWLTAQKAGVFGLWAIIPIVQFFAIAKIAGKPLWWGLLCLIPLVNIVIVIIMYVEVSKKFGRGVGTTLGLIFLPFIFWPILGFGSAEYQN